MFKNREDETKKDFQQRFTENLKAQSDPKKIAKDVTVSVLSSVILGVIGAALSAVQQDQ